MFSKSLHWQSGELSDPFGFCLQIHFSSRGPLLWHLAYSKLERCHPVHLWHLWQILCFYFLLLSSRGSSGMSRTRELTNRISCLDLSPKYRKRPEKLVDVGVQVGLFAFIWVFTFDISFPMFCRPDCLFFFGGGDRLNHRPQSCADGTWTWFAFTTGGIESAHSSGMLYFWQQSGKWVHFKVKIYCQSWE